MNRVVITGLGAVTPLGNSFQESWETAKAGRSGISAITRFDTADVQWKVAGELKDPDANAFLDCKEQRRLDPFVHYAVMASIMAVEDAGLIKKSTISLRRFEKQGRGNQKSTAGNNGGAGDYLSSGGVLIGSSRGGISTIEKALTGGLAKGLETKHFRVSPYLMPSTTISMASSYVAQKIGIKGYCLGISNACASGANALGEAYRLIKAGYGGPIVAGGAEAPVCRLCVCGYGSSGALSGITDFSASRPFDRSRNGFVLAEGACVMVLEELTNALKRGARIRGEIIGYGNTTDAFHQTRPDREGEARAIRTAIDDAGIDLGEIDYINAHGASTPLGDRVESEAIGIVFGKRTSTIPVSSVKSMTGHMLAASGSFEAALTAMTIREGVISPTINLSEKDKDCRINVITRITDIKPRIAISNSFGFGGLNASLVLKGYP